MTLSLGAQLGPYTVVEHVGAGTTAEVYRGHDEHLGRTVALKLLPGTSERARREAAAMTALSHPNIVATFDVIEHDGRLCLIQEWIDGGSVQAELDSVGQFGVTQTVRVGEAVASALSYAHQQGILHRDIKPSNVLRTAEGSYKLVDFGAVGRLRPETSATMAGEIAGTPLYMSPEQLTTAPQTPASDLFGLGLLLYRCLYGHLPDENADTYVQLATSRMQTLISVPPSPLQGLLIRCLALDPAQRPQSADEVLRELRWIAPVATAPGQLGPPLASSAPLSRGLSKATRAIFVGLALVLLLIAGVRLIGIERGLSIGLGLAVVAVALAAAQHVRRRWASRAPEAEQRAATILFGAGQREALTQSLMIEVDQVVRNLNSLDAKFLGMTVVAMIREYEEARDSSERQAALLNVVALMEKLQAHFSPWHVRHKEAIATAIAVLGTLTGVAAVLSGFLK
ncbi:MAG: serine/threonine-protein kinase [Pseudonocardiaceae bacterium]